MSTRPNEGPTSSRPLPSPDDPVLEELFPDRQVREAAKFLLERIGDPPTMAEWLDRSEAVFGERFTHADRRLRAVRHVFEVPTVPKPGGAPAYRVAGWRAKKKATQVGRKLQVEVYTTKGNYCAMCGRGPADGVRLQIDHIIPLEWGGETEPENLQPLCEEHNHGKRDYFGGFEGYADELRSALAYPTVWERIGEFWKMLAADGKRLPAELLPVLGTVSNQGDPARRLRDLKSALGWDYRPRRVKEGRRTRTEYELLHWEPWPPGGPHAMVTAYERARRERKAAGSG